MIHGMQPLLLPQRGVLRWVEEAGEVVVKARLDHADATEDPVKRTGMHAQPLLPEEERDRAAASQGDDVLEGLRCLGKPRAEAAGLLRGHSNFSGSRQTTKNACGVVSSHLSRVINLAVYSVRARVQARTLAVYSRCERERVLSCIAS